MADPISATISIACGAVELAGSIARFLHEREEREQATLQRAAEYQAAQARAAAIPETAAEANAREEQENARRNLMLDVVVDEIYFVLAILGQRLIRMEAVAFEHISGVQTMMMCLWPCNKWKDRFDEKLDDSLKYAIVAAMHFCAECWPMHIYRGFGAPVLNNFTWANPNVSKPSLAAGGRPHITALLTEELDNVIASLKSLPRPPLLTKDPVGVSLEPPDFNGVRTSEISKLGDRGRRKALLGVIEHTNEFVRAKEKCGLLPQPKDGKYKVLVTKTLWATWDSPFACLPLTDAQFLTVMLLQTDPGRLLYGITIGGHLNLQHGEAMEVCGVSARALVQWLHGLPGMDFDIITYAELDIPKSKVKRSTLNYFKQRGVDLENLSATMPNRFMVIPKQGAKSTLPPASLTPVSSPPPAYSSVPPSPLEKDLAAMNIGNVMESKRPVSRRPAPAPPSTLFQARVVHDFPAEAAGELDVRSGQMLDVIKDLGDGWLKAKLPNGDVGIVPKSYTLTVTTG